MWCISLQEKLVADDKSLDLTLKLYYKCYSQVYILSSESFTIENEEVRDHE